MSSKKTGYQALEQKQKSSTGSCTENSSFSFFWFVLFIFPLVTFALAYNLDSSLFFGTTFSSSNFTTSIIPFVQNQETSTLDECAGKYIYVQNIPSKFNSDMLQNCSTLNERLNMCDYLINSGLGPAMDVENSSSTASSGGWFATNQFTLGVIFHNRMKQYKCLTKDSSKASAIFVPFYAGLEARMHLLDSDVTKRDSASIELARFLKETPEWTKMWGHDHFMVAGRVSWDFSRKSNRGSEWGTTLFKLPELKNMTTLLIESDPWKGNTINFDFAIPYPTYFHPSSEYEVHNWQEKMRREIRPYLFSFAGAPRPHLKERNEIINHCLLASEHKNCMLLRCGGPKMNNCENPNNLMRLFQSSDFCLQPRGDTYTRRSTFDAIISGCIPVFFHPQSAYLQYVWYLPTNYTTYSVLIPWKDVKSGNVSIEKRLQEIPREQVLAMREKVISLIPNIIYANPNSRLEKGFEDAFDVAVNQVLSRIDAIRRKMQMNKKGDMNPAVHESSPKD